MKIRLKNLGQKAKDVVAGPTVSTVEYPEVRVSSSQLSGFENCELGEKYNFTFQGEVTALRKPDQWEIRRGEGKNETLGTIRLLKGGITTEPDKEEKS